MSTSPVQDWAQARESVKTISDAVGEVIVGQNAVVEQMLVSLLCRGHCLVVGVPGLAKTLLVSTLGKVLGLSYHRIQFTPDLMPSDILGSEILQSAAQGGERVFKFVRGPIFANLILADEINRTPPKTQAALLEAMQEKQVSVAGETLKLDEPFQVFATQNPIEHEGTYPLPEAQLDRFFLNIIIDYPTLDEERLVLERTASGKIAMPDAVTNGEKLLELQELVTHVPVPEHVVEAILKLTHSSRPADAMADDYVKKYVSWGAGPRASQCLVQGVRALAMLRGQEVASLDEVRALALPVLRHRIIPSYNATGEGIDSEQIIAHLVEQLV